MTPKQARAAELLVEGRTDSEVAAELEMDRTTIWRWRSIHPAFRAELARLRASVWEASEDRLRRMRVKALETLDRALDGDGRGAVRAAMALLRVAPPPPDSAPETAERYVEREVVTADSLGGLAELLNPAEKTKEHVEADLLAALNGR